MNILFATSDAALASALTGALTAAGHSATAVTEASAFADTWAQSGHVELVIIDDMVTPELLNALRAALHDHSALSDASSAPQVLLLSTPPHMAKGNLDRTEEVKRRTPTPTIRRNASATAASSTTTSQQQSASTQPAGTHIELTALPHADAVIVKPFSDAELLSHIRALAAQTSAGQQSSNNPRMLIHGDLMLDTLHSQAFYRGGQQPLALSTREYLTLETLIRANGEFLDFDELLAKVCGTGFFEQRDVMDGVLYSLTRKMRRLGFFITQRGHKYRIR
ncbi:winged helix-turn-helix transcriptional regulator [Bifidobacterium goeldii]|uniref:winged helix-turn-helix transcriptional regulator n=1 Tax=Bifidobacterium goeldii TaxID=2306975 RepID=UPI000F7E5628|nr:winged helix-turn-helix domain-containing protein [Bifidobacterium goeldii]